VIFRQNLSISIVTVMMLMTLYCTIGNKNTTTNTATTTTTTTATTTTADVGNTERDLPPETSADETDAYIQLSSAFASLKLLTRQLSHRLTDKQRFRFAEDLAAEIGFVLNSRPSSD